MLDHAMTSQAPRSAPPATSGSAIDLKTLLITAAASATAAYLCSKLWAAGTLAAAAFTPVIVALVREALTKSSDVVVRAVPVKGVVRSAPPPGAQPQSPVDPTIEQPVAGIPLDAPPPEERVAQLGEVQYHGTGHGSGRHWRLAIVTGLLGFVLCVVLFTVPELLAGNSAAGGDRGTTIFGGKHRDREPATTTTTTTETKTVTLPPAKTVTLPAPAATTTTPTTTQPAPQTTTTPPTTTTNPGEPVVPEPSAEQPPG